MEHRRGREAGKDGMMKTKTDALYEARPKGSLTGRHKKALGAAGFYWSGSAWIRQGRGPRPWGCNVAKYRPSKREDTLDKCVGIILGTHDEFGRRISSEPKAGDL